MTNDADQLTRRALLRASAATGAVLLAGCASHDHEHQHPAGSWTALDDPARDARQRPAEVVAALAITEGMVVADVGAGTGYFEPYLSRAVGPRGRVLALDVDPELVAHMRRRFAEEGLANVEARLVATTDPGLAAGSVDRLLVVDVWHHMSDRVAYARKLRRALAPGGRLVIVDYPEDAPRGPPPELRVDADAVVAELTAAGLVARVEPRSLPEQYVVVAEPGRRE